MPNRTPPVTVSPQEAAVTWAVLRGARTVRTVPQACGMGIETAHRHLRHARRRGLVAWVDGKQGTLRPGVKVVR